MKILHTIPSLKLSAGGPSTCTYHLLKGLNAIGVQADILTLSSKEAGENIGTDDFIKRVPFDATSPLVYSCNFKKYLQKHTNYDLYHANAIWSFPSHDTRVIAKNRNKPFVLATHGMLYPQAIQVSSWKKKMTLSLFQRKDLEMADCLQATCETELMHIRQFGLKNPVAIIPNCLYLPVIPEIRRKENSIRRFAFVGRIHPIKNIDLLIRAWIRLGAKTKDAELLIIGDGDVAYKQKLKELSETHSLGNIHFLGFLHGDKLQEVTSSLDFQLLPSKSENFGMVVPEALIQGIPVIAGKGTPWQELETHHCGWWIESTVDALAQTLEQALSMDEDTRKVMGANGQRLVLENYTMDTIAWKMRQLYDYLLNGIHTDLIKF